MDREILSCSNVTIVTFFPPSVIALIPVSTENTIYLGVNVGPGPAVVVVSLLSPIARTKRCTCACRYV